MHMKRADSGILSSSEEASNYHESHEDDPLIPIDPCTAEKRLLRKLDGRILPITCVLYLFAYLDRSNLGNARLQGLPEDVLEGDPTGVLFDWLVAIFFIPYILCQVPCTILSKYYNPRVWIGCSAILWGLCSTSMSVGNDFESLLIARLCLGIFEAAFGPSVVLYYSFYYTKAEYGTRIASWFGFGTVAGVFGGLLAYGIQHVKISIANWRLLFIIEGVPTVLLGMLCLFILPGRPESANFLTHAERKLAMERMNRGTSGDIGAVVNQRHVVAALLDWRIYIAGVVGFALHCALTSVSAFLPTIIETMGYSPAISQLMTVPPYAVAALTLLIASYTSDRIQSRGLMVVFGCTLGGIGYMILLGVAQVHIHIRYLATFCIAAGTYASLGLILAWYKYSHVIIRPIPMLPSLMLYVSWWGSIADQWLPLLFLLVTHNLGSETKRAAGMPLFGAIGQVGSILGSHSYPLTEGPAYLRGFGVSGALMFLAAFSALMLTTSYRWENARHARRNAAYGEPDRDAPVDTSELADKAPGFRYLP
ncbi:MFS general substrate transporter [Boletus edulis BED1]|uniref:MFS general substrate transporter n=1 Tax=Boletus edulis BED1 TaxID=1328754 RepID=A0AAD4BFS9_BOLED|nr:MFS general substrate transporter [Boletus edulis BED1]